MSGQSITHIIAPTQTTHKIAEKILVTAPRWRGAWDSATAYVVHDVVSYLGSSYVAIDSSTNDAPPSANWTIIASKGDAGSDGLAGPAGADGPAGANGADGAAGPSNVIAESSGPTDLTVGAVAEGQVIGRFGATAIGLDVEATADITLAVTAAGSDSDATRQKRPTAGDLTAKPFLTVDGALAALPKYVRTARVNLPAGNLTGGTGKGFAGDALQLVGTWATPTLASGATSGTAGAGSGATLLNNPLGADDWVAGALVGKLVLITGGGGYLGLEAFVENVARIKSNTATQAVLEFSMYGLDGTSTFELVEEGTVFSAVAADTYYGGSYILGFINTTCDVRLTRIRIDNSTAGALTGLLLAQTQFADVIACSFKNAFAMPSYSSNLRMLSTFLDASYLYVYDQTLAVINGVVGVDSAFQVERFTSLTAANIWMDGDIGYSNAVHISHGGIATLGGDISNCLNATPLLLDNVRQFSVSGTLTGTNAAQVYGARVQGGGQFKLSGMSLAGNTAASVVRVEDASNLSYAQISGNGALERSGTFVIGGTPGTRVLLEAVQSIDGQIFLYGFIRPQGNAYTDITASPTQTQVGATAVGYLGSKIIACANDDDSVRLLGGADILVTGGLPGSVINATVKRVKLFPPTGQLFYVSGVAQAVDAPVDLFPGDWLDYLTDNDGNYWLRG